MRLIKSQLTRTEVERELHHGAFIHLIAQWNIWQPVSVHIRADSVGSVQSSRNQKYKYLCLKPSNSYLENLMPTPRGDLVLSSSPATILISVVWARSSTRFTMLFTCFTASSRVIFIAFCLKASFGSSGMSASSSGMSVS